jgi:K+-transporting ATPase KdpF subunit
MTVEYALSAIVAVLLLGYLLYALIMPDRF